MTNAVAQIIQEFKQLPETDRDELAHWLLDEYSLRNSRLGDQGGRALGVNNLRQNEARRKATVSPRLLVGAARDSAGATSTPSGIELLWVEMLREKGDG